MAIKTIGTGTFGASAYGTSAQSASETDSLTEYTWQDAEGDTAGVALCDHVTETTVTIISGVGDSTPSIGNEYMSYGYVISITKTASNAAFQTLELTCKKWASVG